MIVETSREYFSISSFGRKHEVSCTMFWVCTNCTNFVWHTGTIFHLVRQSQKVQSVMLGCQCVLSHLLPVLNFTVVFTLNFIHFKFINTLNYSERDNFIFSTPAFVAWYFCFPRKVCDKISRSIWTHDQIKENGNNVRIKHFIYNPACTLFQLRKNGMFSETVKQIRKQYKITSCQMFFLKITLHFFFALDAM